MAHLTTITFFRGPFASMPTLADGEPGWATDTFELYIGQGGTNRAVNASGVATAVAVADTTDATCFVGLFESATGNLEAKTDGGLTYNATTGTLTATAFVGPLTGNVAGNLTGDVTGNVSGNAGTVTVADAGGDTTTFPLLATDATGSLSPRTDAGITYNAATNALTTTTFIGALTGNASTASTAAALTTPRTIGGVSFDGTANIVPTTIEVAEESTDVSCFPLFVTAAGTQQLQPKTSNGSFLFNSSTGAVRVATLELGNDTDTTLARDGAGELSIEGKRVYRADGTDVIAADGGTGRSSHTAFAVLCGGTTTTAAQQDVGSLGSAGQVLTSAGAGALPSWASVTAGAIGYIVLEDQKATTVGGGSSTSGSWETRTLNTEVVDTHNDCTLASNQFDLVAGTYLIIVNAPAYDSSYHQARLANIDDTTYTYGTSEFNVTNCQSFSRIILHVTIAATKTYEVQHRVNTSEATIGYGVPNSFGGTEVYTQVVIIRIA